MRKNKKGEMIKMKKVVALAVALLMVVGLAACATTPAAPAATESSAVEATEAPAAATEAPAASFILRKIRPRAFRNCWTRPGCNPPANSSRRDRAHRCPAHWHRWPW